MKKEDHEEKVIMQELVYKKKRKHISKNKIWLLEWVKKRDKVLAEQSEVRNVQIRNAEMRGGYVYASIANINGNWHTVVLVVCK